MVNTIWTAAVVATLVLWNASSGIAVEPAHDYPIRPVPARHVQFRDTFWWPRLEVNRTATVPVSFQMCEETGRIENFKIAGGISKAKWTGMAGFNDSDVYKVMEGAAYSLMTHPDPKLAAYLNQLVGWVAKSQEKDGYLYTQWTARDRIAEPNPIRCCIPRDNKQWMSEKDSHELYNLGHMYEAAVAHWEATGDPSFLNIAKKSAELLLSSFGPGKLELPPGHPEIELALVKLYRATGDERYLSLAKFFLNVRGRPSDDRPKLWGPYTQDHAPLVEQQEAVGHAVRAMYLYAAATDVAALTGDDALRTAVDRQWASVFGKKTYITGAIGSTASGEAFGNNYELPNETAYAETCANLATCLWNHRMFLLHGDSEYIDMLERSLYNGVVSGVALDGKTFFYPNPLASSGKYARSKWFDCACCPSNICRFIPSIPGYAYAVEDRTVYVNLYVAGSAELELSNGKVRIEQQTNYPWDGRVTIKVTPQSPGQQFELRLRIPGWVTGSAFPMVGNPFSEDESEQPLYSFLDEPPQESPTALLNGSESVPIHRQAFQIDRAWKPGDTLTLDLPMPVRRVVANDKVAADRGRVALMRGPIVYCVEWPDVEGSKVLGLSLPDDAELKTEFRQGLLGGVQVIVGETSADGRRMPFVAIPYYAWANRGPGEMAVWLQRAP